MAVEYKFKPYQPTNLKLAPTTQDDTLKSLQTQKENLDKRLRLEGVNPDTLGGDFDNRNLIEKALNLTPDQGVLMDFFEVINRPVEAVKGAISAGYSGEDALEGAWKGLSGQETISGSKLLKETFGVEPQTAVGKFITDVAVDIALDPLTYIPAGFFFKGFKKLTTTTRKVVLDASSEIQERVVRESLQKFGSLDEAFKVAGDGRIFKLGDDGQQFIVNSAKRAKGATKQTGFLQKRYDFYKNWLDDFNAGKVGKTRIIDGKKYTLRNSTIVELQGIDEVASAIRSIGPDFDVIVTSTGNKLDDIAIIKRYGDSDYFTRIGGIDAKDLTSGAAKGKTSTLELLTSVGGKKTLGFSKGTVIAQQGDTAFQERFFKGLNAIRTKDGKNLYKLIVEAGQSAGTKGKQNVQFFQQVLPDDIPALKNLLIDYSKQFDMDLIYAANAGERGLFFKFEDVFDDIDWSKTYAAWSPSGVANAAGQKTMQFRMFPQVNFNLDAIKEKGLHLLSDDIATMFKPGEMEYSINIFKALAERGGKIGKIADTVDRFAQKMKSFFSLTGDFDEAGKLAYKKIEGEAGVFMQRQSARLAELRKTIIEKYPKAGPHISELFEAGAYVDEATGAVKTMARDYSVQDFLGYVTKRVGDGVDIPMPQFADEAARLNFAKQINKIAEDAGFTDDLFEVVTKGNATGLKYTGTFDDLKKMITHTQTFEVEDAFFHFGRKKLSQEAQDLLRNMPKEIGDAHELMNDILTTLVREGGFDDIATSLAGQMGYMRHIMTKGAYESLQMTMPGVASKFARPGSDVLGQRTFLGSIDEVNAGLKEFYNLEMDLFDPNAFNAMENLISVTARKVEQRKMLGLIMTAKDRTGKSFFQVVDNTKPIRDALEPNQIMVKSFKEEFSPLYKNLSSGSQKELNKVLKEAGFGPNSALVLNRNAHGILKRVEKAYIDLPKWVKTYDKFLNTWKGVTLISPGFHLRNMFGNSFNSYAVGMDLAAQSKYGTRAMVELNQYNDILKKFVQGGKLTDPEKAIFNKVKKFQESGLVQSHRGVRDLEQVKEATEEALKKSKSKIATGYNNVVRLNFNFAEKMDDVQRYMLFSWALDKTGDVGKASRTVSESLFDYSHLTAFEKDVMKRVFPFYTFMKNNFIFQAKNIMINPKQYARAGRAYNYYLEDIAGYNAEDLPDYATENMWLPIPITVNKNDKKAIAFLKANLPLSDFTELVENPFKKGVISISAPIKLPIELGLGRDLFTGETLTAFPGERSRMAAGEGVFSFLRDERGNLAVTQNPLVQKIANDLGLRVPLNYASVGLDAIDTLAGYQGGVEGVADFAQRLGLVGVQELDKLELTALYQDLERLRELKKYYEQETGNQLPPLPRG